MGTGYRPGSKDSGREMLLIAHQAAICSPSQTRNISKGSPRPAFTSKVFARRVHRIVSPFDSRYPSTSVIPESSWCLILVCTSSCRIVGMGDIYQQFLVGLTMSRIASAFSSRYTLLHHMLRLYEREQRLFAIPVLRCFFICLIAVSSCTSTIPANKFILARDL
jgi:hypothetical protein